MKKLLIGLGVLVVLVVAAVVVIPMMIPVETYKQELSAQVKQATGRDLAINGDISISVLPSLEMRVEDVTFGNAPGGRAAQMATMKAMLLKLDLMAALSRRIEIDQFVLVEPVINLEKGADGRGNWEIGGASAPSPVPAGQPSQPAAQPPASEGGAPLQDIRLGDVRIENGRLSYFDAATGQETVLGDMNMTVGLESLDSPLDLDGSLVWNGKQIAIDTTVERPRAAMAGGSTALALNVSSEPISLTFDGQAAMAQPLKLAGKVVVDSPSLRSLADWLGSPIAGSGDTFGKFRIEGDLDMVGQKIAFTGAQVAFDAITGEGGVTVDLAGAKPAVVATLEVGALDANPYLGGPAAQPAGEQAASQPAQPAAGAPAPQGWSEDPIDLSGLGAVNADLTLAAESLKVQQISVGRAALHLMLKDGRLQADLNELQLYEGAGKGSVTVDSSGGGKPRVAAAFNLTGVNSLPLLTDAAQVDWLDGKVDLNLDVTTTGASQKEMVGALGGKAGFIFRDGAIVGVNLGAMVRNVQSAFMDAEAGVPQKTDFAELSASFDIARGIATNKDLTMLAPLVRLSGAGTVDMPQRTVQYRVEPKLAATKEGQGGGEAAGIMVPVIISGPWHDISYTPDLAAVATDLLKDPAKLQKAVEGVGGEAGKLLEGVTDPGKAVEGQAGKLLEGLTGSGTAKEGESANPVGKLKGLFGE